MTDKIKTCKPSLINNRADFNYRFEYVDSTNAEWAFDLQTMTAKQIGAVMASIAVVKLNSEGLPETELQSNMELSNTVMIYNALRSWNLDEPITIDNIDMMPKGVRTALLKAITTHEDALKSELPSQVKN